MMYPTRASASRFLNLARYQLQIHSHLTLVSDISKEISPVAYQPLSVSCI